MKSLSHKYRFSMVLILFLLIGTAGFAQIQSTNSQPDESIKSYFLLQLNLASDPVDLQNYFDALDFKQDVQVFADQYATRTTQLDTEESRLLKWAITDGLNGDLDQSLKQFHQVLVFSKIQSDKELLAAIYALMSRIVELKGDYHRARSYMEQSLATATAAGISRQQAFAYQSRGRLQSLQGKHDEAETDLLKKALPAFSRIKNQAAIADCYREIANHYLRRKMYTQSNWFYLQSLQTARKAGYATGMINALSAIGQFKYDTQAYAEACKDWREAEQEAIKAQQLKLLLKLKFNLSRGYHHLGNGDMSAKYALEFEQLRDILLNPVL